MHALRLITRKKRDGIEEEAALLVYDSLALSGTILSDDVRDHFNEHPIAKSVYILAPFVEDHRIKELLFEGSLFDRVRVIFKKFSGQVSIITFSGEGDEKRAVVIPFEINEQGDVIENRPSPIDPELRNGWLFTLFDSNHGLVNAPPGVHFGKGSKKHTSKFLRVSAVLLTSEACAALAFFTLASMEIYQPKRIFVDTAPLISVAFALQRIAILHGLWQLGAPVSSFSSYGGIERLPRPSPRDLTLVSASTSGGLIQLLVDRGFLEKSVILLFFLGRNSDSSTVQNLICDLTFRRGLLYGYEEIENFTGSNCPLCNDGHFLAALEGDQFMLESRAVKKMVVRVKTQPKEARTTVELLSRNRLVSIPIFAQGPQRFEFDFDISLAMKVAEVGERIVKLIRRFMPAPLDYIILIDIDKSTFDEIIKDSNLTEFVTKAKVLQYSDLRSAEKIRGAGVLVFSACLKDYVKVRDVNAELRTIAEDGCIAYLSAITLAESPEQLAALRNFLTYGAKGRDSFTFVSAFTLMQPFNHGQRSSWDSELELLRKIEDAGDVEEEITRRIANLQLSANRQDGLFWDGSDGPLQINNDFVYLDTVKDRDLISQADLYVVITNLVASARLGDRSIISVAQNEPIRWQQSVYGQTLLAVENFEDYNDSVLRAAFLRAASSAELNYSTDSDSSARILEILRQGILGWPHKMGDFLPEFVVSLATRRLTLTDADKFQTKALISDSELPEYLKKICKYI